MDYVTFVAEVQRLANQFLGEQTYSECGTGMSEAYDAERVITKFAWEFLPNQAQFNARQGEISRSRFAEMPDVPTTAGERTETWL